MWPYYTCDKDHHPGSHSHQNPVMVDWKWFPSSIFNLTLGLPGRQTISGKKFNKEKL